MKLLRLIALSLAAMVGVAPAIAADQQTISGNGALALAALVSDYAPLPASKKNLLADFLAGNSNSRLPADTQIVVAADQITCRASTVDLASHSCELVFGQKRITLSGRKAHELYATLIEVGVTPDGAAGTTYEAVSKLACTIDPKQVENKDGGGATCQFTSGQP
jgi:hypothetical protein